MRVATTVARDGDTTSMTYHKTVVAKYNHLTRVVKLNTGGYKTFTTKKRMNQFADDLDLPFTVFQKNHKWYVNIFGGDTLEFDGDEIEFQLPGHTTQDVINTEHNLEPLVCKFCGSTEVTFMQYVGDARCASCGRWQCE